MSFVIAGNSASTGYNLTRSLRFRSSASAYLSRTPASASNQKTWTWSGWVKRGKLSSEQMILTVNYAGTTDSTRLLFYFTSADILRVDTYTAALRQTNAVYRDPSAWYHIVLSVDTTQATAANRMLMYVNGVSQSFSSSSTITQNSDLAVNSTLTHYLGYYNGSTLFYDGYLTEINFIDGQALTPSSFGSTNTLTGVWQPAAYTGSYGTNGFELQFTDNSALTTSSNVGLGKDFSGNGNYWVTNNISITSGVTYDSMTDVPTLTSATAANFAVLNPLDNGGNTVSNGNLVVNTATGFDLIRSTMFLSSGKWYWEVTCDDCGGGFVGISSAAEGLNTRGAETANSATINTTNGDLRTNATNSAYGSAVADGNVMMFALDMDSGKFWAGKSGTWFNSGDPTAGTNAGKTGLTVAVSPSISVYDNEDYTANFGQRPFTYTPPTGFVALNTFNLPTSTIVKGNTVMDATLYTGNGSTQTITNAAGFKPDFVWAKDRSAAYEGGIYDSVRGTGTLTSLTPSSTRAESGNTTDFNLTSFNSNGFSLGTTSGTNVLNRNGDATVAWQWQAGQGSSSSNTNGTITSTVSVNASAGFSVVTFTTTAGVKTVGHGLGVAPALIIVKPRAVVADWYVYGSSYSNTQYLKLNTTDALITDANLWNSTTATSSVFTLGSSWGSGNALVAYCWTPIAGFSAFGSYTGNGSTDGPFVYTGFRPRWIMVKQTNTSGSSWILFDTARNTFNAVDNELFANLSNAESASPSGAFDLLSNGFKIRSSAGSRNDSGGTYIYMAFAETPTKFALAR